MRYLIINTYSRRKRNDKQEFANKPHLTCLQKAGFSKIKIINSRSVIKVDVYLCIIDWVSVKGKHATGALSNNEWKYQPPL